MAIFGYILAIYVLIHFASAWRRSMARGSVDRELGLLQYAKSIGMEFYVAYPGPHKEAPAMKDSPYDGVSPLAVQTAASLLGPATFANDIFGAITDPFTLQFTQFEPFNADIGYGRELTELMVASDPLGDQYMFRYSYWTGDSDSRTVHVWSVAAVRVPLDLPKLTLRNETFVSKIGEHLGLKQLHFESNEFNERYCVQCGDEKKAYAIIDPKMIEFLMGIPPHRWQMQGPWILIANQVGEHDPEECLQRLHAIQGFNERIPAFVKEDIRMTPYWHNALDLGYAGSTEGQ